MQQTPDLLEKLAESLLYTALSLHILLKLKIKTLLRKNSSWIFFSFRIITYLFNLSVLYYFSDRVLDSRSSVHGSLHCCVLEQDTLILAK